MADALRDCSSAYVHLSVSTTELLHLPALPMYATRAAREMIGRRRREGGAQTAQGDWRTQEEAVAHM